MPVSSHGWSRGRKRISFQTKENISSSLHDMKKRNENKYVINNAKTYRYKVSSVPHMQCLLNQDVKEQNVLLDSLKSHCNLVNCDLCTHI